MSNAAHDEEEKRFALVNAKLDAELKEAEIAEKTKPWRTLASPTTLMALLTALTTVTAGAVAVIQSLGQGQSEREARAFGELSAERALVQNIMQQSGSKPEDVRDKLTALAIAGLLPTTMKGLIAAGLIDPAKLSSASK
jgi:Kef-type K+ transport system membrane component KefB